MSSNLASTVRRPAVAGTFYPAGSGLLRSTVERLIAEAAPPPVHGSLRALIAPHAGYVYSGPIAASAYAVLAGAAARPHRIALLGPSHYLAFTGLAVPEAEALETPLGVVPVDPVAASLPERFPQVLRSDRAHQREHSLEVQLPFLQCVLSGGFTVVPLAVGRARPEAVSEVIELLWNLPDTLVLVSTDLSHYLPATEARRVDARTAAFIVAEEFERLDADMACGHHPLAGLVLAAKRAGFSIVQLDLRNSSDTAGEPDQVVGYGAFAVLAPPMHAPVVG